MDVSLVFDDRNVAEAALTNDGMQRAWSKASDALPGFHLEFDSDVGVEEGRLVHRLAEALLRLDDGRDARKLD